MEDWSTKFEIEGDSPYYVELLHNVPSLVDECCDLINLEWKRSHLARIRSIENSCENFPISLVLLRKFGSPKVVGHCKISKLSLSNTKVFVETVVIHPELRGKGLGKYLMRKCEELCKSKNIKWIYLSTQGQEAFYEKLGYSKCLPISIYGCQLNTSNENINQISKINNKPEMKSSIKNNPREGSKVPPPPPLPITTKPSLSDLSSTKTFMRKEVIY